MPRPAPPTKTRARYLSGPSRRTCPPGEGMLLLLTAADHAMGSRLRRSRAPREDQPEDRTPRRAPGLYGRDRAGRTPCSPPRPPRISTRTAPGPPKAGKWSPHGFALYRPGSSKTSVGW